MKLGDKEATYMSLPPNLQKDETYAMGAAIDKQMRKLLKLTAMVQVWSDIDNVDPKYYGLLAACIKAPYYDSSFDDKTKLAIIKGTLGIYRLAGSKAAITQLIANIFGSGTFEPWYEYGGKPYHFRITTSAELTPDVLSKFAEILEKVKRARSVLDAVSTDQPVRGEIYFTTRITEGELMKVKEMDYV